MVKTATQPEFSKNGPRWQWYRRPYRSFGEETEVEVLLWLFVAPRLAMTTKWSLFGGIIVTVPPCVTTWDWFEVVRPLFHVKTTKNVTATIMHKPIARCFRSITR